MVNEEQLIVSVPKNKSEEVRIIRKFYKGTEIIDMRVFYLPPGSKEFLPSKKGLTLTTRAFREFREALNMVELPPASLGTPDKEEPSDESDGQDG